MVTINDCGQAGTYEYKGLSTDVKPADCAVNSLFLELDTGYFFYFDGTKWVKMKGGDGYSSFKALINRTITEITPEMTEGITSICTHAFRGCSRLTKVSVSEGVISIFEFAFYGCSELSDLTLPESLTTISDCAFEGCSSLADLNLKSGMRYIGDFAFKNCSSLPDLMIPPGTLTIGKYSFELCTYAANLALPNSLITIGEGAFKDCQEIGRISIPNGITKIEKETFYNCNNVINLSISNSVKNIGEKAFAFCDRLGSINLPDNIETVGHLAFSYCSSVTSINLKRVKFIGDGCFKGCIRLPYASIPNSTGQANGGWWSGSSFAECTNLKEVYIENGVTRIGDKTFLECYSLETINFPGSLGVEGNIGEYAFADCHSLKSVVISNGISEIADYAFKGCRQLKTVDIPSTISYIGKEAFQDTIFVSFGIEDIYIRSSGPPKLGVNAFDTWAYGSYNGPNIRVPSESVNSYKNATNWSSYNSHIMSI